MEDVVGRTAAVAVLIWWDAQKATACSIGQVVASGEEEVYLASPGVGGGGVEVFRCAEAAGGIKLYIFV